MMWTAVTWPFLWQRMVQVTVYKITTLPEISSMTVRLINLI